MSSYVHDMGVCQDNLHARPEFDRFRCQPQTFDCDCGRHYEHVCDEAEGCSWTLVEADRDAS